MSKTNVTNFLKSLAEKAGVSQDDPKLLEVLSITELNKIDLPIEIVNSINQNLLSIEDAKNNHPNVKTHYFGEIMANVDRALEKFYKYAELDQDQITELNKETSSTKRIALLGEMMKTVIEEKSKVDTKPNEKIQSLTTQINQLNDNLRIEKEARAKEATDHTKALNDYKTNSLITGKVSGLKTIYDNLPSDVRVTTIDTLLKKELQDSEVLLILNDDGNLKLQKKDGSNYFDENNRLVSVDDFINKTLAKHKVLQQSASNTDSGQPANTGQPTNVDASQTTRKKVNLDKLFDESTKPLVEESNGMPKML